MLEQIGASERTIRIPITISQPSRIPPGQVSETQVRLADIAPTILGLVGIPQSPEFGYARIRRSVACGRTRPDTHQSGQTSFPKVSGNHKAARGETSSAWVYRLDEHESPMPTPVGHRRGGTNIWVVQDYRYFPKPDLLYFGIRNQRFALPLAAGREENSP